MNNSVNLAVKMVSMKMPALVQGFLLRAMLLLLLGGSSFSTHAGVEAAARIVSFYGDVQVSLGTGNHWRKITKAEDLYIGTTIRTGRLSGVSLRTEDETLIRLSQNSEFKIEQLRFSSFWRYTTAQLSSLSRTTQTIFRLFRGKLWGRNNNRQQNTRIATVTATIGIRGTEYVIQTAQDKTLVSIAEGKIVARNQHGETTVLTGEQGVIERGQRPRIQADKYPEDTLQWVADTPDVLDIPSLLKRGLDDKRVTAQVYAYYQQRRYAKAADMLQPLIKKQPHNMRLWLINAWLHIKGGESAGVYKSLKILAKYSPGDIKLNEVAAYAAFIYGKTDIATALLDRLQGKHGLSDTGWIIRGFLAEAKRELTTAANAYQQAIKLNPRQMLARLKLAKIYIGKNQTQLAARLIEQVLQKHPQHGEARTLRGFIALRSEQSARALEEFQAILEDGVGTADTWFGLTLAYLQQGRTAEAVQSIATAVLLEPRRSIYLSYWGKMLHQIGRALKALVVLDSASRLDPNDPTPHLYKAIILHDMNRPGAAISELQTAIKLNENQGIYRSRSLLDQDLAIQNVDLSRLFTELGLAEWAHQDVMRLISQNDNHYSAHLQHAGALQSLAGRGYAAASELLLARLMQPVNINTFSRGYESTGMFDMPGQETHVAMSLGNHHQHTLSLNTNGVNSLQHIAWSVDALSDSSDGWRDDNGESLDKLSISGKWQPDHQNNVFVSLSLKEAKTVGDMDSRLSIDAPPDDYAMIKRNSLRLDMGLQHRISDQHYLLGYLSINDVDVTYRDSLIDKNIQSGSGVLTQEIRMESSQRQPENLLQLQGNRNQGAHQLKYGLIAYQRHSQADTIHDYGLFDQNHHLLNDLIALDERIRYTLDIRSLTLYAQDNWYINDKLSVDWAMYLERMDNADVLTGGEWRLQETTGRLGLVWQTAPQHTIRLAHFNYLLPFMSARLDPVEVAGIPVFRGAHEGSLMTESDLVWEYHWQEGMLSTNLYRVEERYTYAVLEQGKQIENTSVKESKGVDVTLNRLLGNNSGLNVKLARFRVSHSSKTEQDRDEGLLTIGYKKTLSEGWHFGLQQIYRKIKFQQSIQNELIAVTNATLGFDFDHKKQRLDLSIHNLFGRSFNWITDEFSAEEMGIAPERMFLLGYRLSF